MKLGPELMRLSMESAQGEDSENEANNCDKSSEDQTDNEREENDFLDA